MNVVLATKLIERSLLIQKECNDLAWFIEENLEPDEIKLFKRQVAEVMATLYSGIMSPLFREYPGLLPPELKEQSCDG